MFIEELIPKAREKLVTIVDGARLIDAAKLLRPGTDLVIVTDPAGLLVGVVTRTDIVSQFSFCEESSCVADILLIVTRDVLSCRPVDKIEDVWVKIKAKGVKNIPVTDEGGKPLGVLKARDVFEVLLGEAEYEEALLRDYVMGVGYR